MAATSRGPTPPVAPRKKTGAPAPAEPLAPSSVAARLFHEGHAFDFFQAVRLLCLLGQEGAGGPPGLAGRAPPGREAPPRAEAVRFRAHLSLTFPPSPVYEITPPTGDRPAILTATFLGLTGPSGVLPRHYTQMLLRQEREGRGPEKRALRDWLDLFNHRLISLFYRAWEKYRFFIPYERKEWDRDEPDPFTQALFSFIGLGTPALRRRLRVTVPERAGERELARIEDLGLLRYVGLLAPRRRNALGLRALLEDYFDLPVRVAQFQGQWLQLDVSNQSRLGVRGCNAELGINTVAGERVWDVEGKVRLCLGPLNYARFLDLIPDRAPLPERKTFFLLCHLARLYLGPERDFDVQLILRAEDVPECRLTEDDPIGPRLGWNTWASSQQPAGPVGDVVFESSVMSHQVQTTIA
jgi:type VI secretion system protein ImpH